MNQIRVSSNHKNHAELHTSLEEAQKWVKIGGIYSHYKYPENTYKVLNLGFREASDEICVIYQATYDPQLIFIRELSSWLETPTHNGQKVSRFELVE